MDLDLIKGVGPATAKKLETAGVSDVETLAKGDKDELAEVTGISPDKLDSFITQAQGLVAAESAAPEEPTTPSTTRTKAAANGNGAKANGDGEDTSSKWRVILQDRAATARVRAGEVTYENLPIVTAKLEEDEETIMREISYNAVLLKEQATTASVRVDATWETGVPIYKERHLENTDGVAELTRVRVHEIRDRAAGNANGGSADAAPSADGKKGFLAKLLGR